MSRPNNGVQRARLILVLISLGIMLGTTVATVDAQTSAETGVSVTIVDEGALDITWVTTETTFLADGEAPALAAANPSATVSAAFSLAIDDSRTDANRSGYSISLRAGAFTADGSPSVIGPDLLAITDVTGLPQGNSAPGAIDQSLDAPVTVLTVASGAGAVSTTITVTIAMTLPPGTMPGTYSGGITFDVVPVSSP